MDQLQRDCHQTQCGRNRSQCKSICAQIIRTTKAVTYLMGCNGTFLHEQGPDLPSMLHWYVEL